MCSNTTDNCFTHPRSTGSNLIKKSLAFLFPTRKDRGWVKQRKVSGSSARGRVRVWIQIQVGFQSPDSVHNTQLLSRWWRTRPLSLTVGFGNADPGGRSATLDPSPEMEGYRSSVSREPSWRADTGFQLTFNSSLLLGMAPGLHPLSDCGAGPGQLKHSWHSNLGTTEMSLEFPRCA